MVWRFRLLTFDGIAVDLLNGRYSVATEQQAGPQLCGVVMRRLWRSGLASPPRSDRLHLPGRGDEAGAAT